MRVRIVVVSLLAAALGACDATPRPTSEAVASSYLVGEEKLCLSDVDCASTVCSYGVCAGLTSADRPWMTDAITAALGARVERGDLELPDLRRLIARELEAERHPDLKRARLLRGWARLDLDGAAAAALPLFESGTPILRFEAARVLLRRHDPRAEAWLVEQVVSRGPALVPFLVPEWRFFAPPARATILGLVAARGDATLRSRLETLDQQEP